MAAKFVVILSLAVAASAVPLVPVAKLAYAEEVYPPAHYEFEYSVHDDHTGDIKQQKEARHGDSVQGSYSLVQPDGVLRVVDYTADKEHGFNANVRYEGHPAPAPAHHKVLAAPVAYAPVQKIAYAPVQKISYAPVQKISYAPVQKIAYATPVAKFAYAAAPVAKVAYAAPLGHVTFSSPAISYHH